MSGLSTKALSLDELAQALPKEGLSVTEIAQMPFPLSMVAMRRFYNKDWHKPEADGETVTKFRVEFRYSYRDDEFWSCEIDALTEEEAKTLAQAEFDKAMRWQEDVEIESVEAEVVEAGK